ncbi:hypothetical protein D3C80_1336280 [compost metagenome]
MRLDWLAHSRARSSALPMTMLEADRLHRMRAPASAARVDGGCGAQKSSQISTAKTKPGRLLASNTRPGAKSTLSPLRTTASSDRLAAGANQRFS